MEQSRDFEPSYDTGGMIQSFAFLAYCYLRTGSPDKALINATQCEEYTHDDPFSRSALLAYYASPNSSAPAWPRQ
jgi:hypothetical protein